MAKRVCIEPGCPTITDTTRCTAHERARDAARGTTTQRGYGAAHQSLRATLAPAATGMVCHLCGDIMRAGQRLALDHTPDRTGYRGMTHESCNARDGARRASRAS